MRHDDDDGQVDGDAPWARPGELSPFARSFGEQPWVRSNVPPWHMWGNSQIIDVAVPDSSDTSFPVQTPGQIFRVSYKRPETWHWLFGARIVNAPNTGVGQTASITIQWDLISGIGRSQQQMLGFDRFRWVWAGAAGVPPFAHVMWATSTRTPALDYVFSGGVWLPDATTIRTINQISGQDLQLNVRVNWFMSGTPFAPLQIEVGGFIAPKTHVRPDWFLGAAAPSPLEALFAGEETKGQ